MRGEEGKGRTCATSPTNCCCLIQVTGNYSDLFWGHSAWFIYQVGEGLARGKGETVLL